MRVQSVAVLTLAGALAATGAFAGAGAGAVAGPVEISEVAPGGGGDNYGTSAQTALVITAFDCDTFSQADTWSPVGGSPNRFLTAGFFECGVFVPSGAQVIRIEVEACDTSATQQVSALFARTTTPAGSGAAIASVGTGAAATPGCNRFPLTLPAPEVIDNGTRKYFVEVTTGNTNATIFGAVRVYYRLQVSPAPAVASFTDVPIGHPQLRFVEALVAAGVTGGCGGGNYCPDAPVTRGQMAVFLATSLGLHFAP